MKYKCEVCNGLGGLDAGNPFGYIVVECGNCEGTGEVDWVRRVCPLKWNEEKEEWE